MSAKSRSRWRRNVGHDDREITGHDGARNTQRGNYASNFEPGNYIMCDSVAYEETAACKPAQASAGDLLKALGGLAGALKGLSNSTR